MKSINTMTIVAIGAAALLAVACGDDGTPDTDVTTDAMGDVAGDSGPQDDVGGTDLPAGDAVEPNDVHGDTDTVETPSVVRFVFFSDLHFRAVDGDQKHNKDVGTLVEMINGLAGDFDMVVSGGDNYDHILPGWEADPLASPMAWYVEEMDKLKMPWIASIGNHEFYDYFGDIPTTTDDGASRGEAFSTVMGAPLYYSTEVNGIKLIILNSMEEGSWGETHGLMGKFSKAQLDWLRAELDQGKPSFLFFHHPPSSLATRTTGGLLCDVLNEYPETVKGVFAGHTHGFWRGEYCGAPYWVVEDFHNNPDLWFEVEYNAGTDTVTIMNADAISFPEVPEFTCEPGESTVENPETAIGTLQRLNVVDGISDATGIGELLGEALGSIPFVMSFDAYDAVEGYTTRLTIASRWEVDGFLTYVDGSPCLEVALRNEDGVPCFEAGPFNIEAQVISFLAAVSDEPVNPDWKAVLDIRNMVLEGKIGNAVDGTPIISDGLVSATIMRDPTVQDLKGILVGEYCGGRADGCVPGENDMPVCPATLDDAAVNQLFLEIPSSCDVIVMGFGIQGIITMFAELPEETHVTGKIVTENLIISATKEDGGQVAENLFLTTEGQNCAAE